MSTNNETPCYVNLYNLPFLLSNLLSPNGFFPILSFKTPAIYSFLYLKDHIAHQYKTISKSTVLYL